MTKRYLLSLTLAITPLCAQTLPVQAVPVAGSQSIRTNGGLGTIRLGASDDGVWFGWRIMQAYWRSNPQLSLWEVLEASPKSAEILKQSNYRP